MHFRESHEVAAEVTLPTSIPRGLILSDRYLIGPIIGEGGMGTVCEAFHLGLDVPVAIKVIRADLRDTPEFVQRFLNEGRAAASLKGEHIARVYDVGQLDSGEPYLVMEKLDGIELETFIQESGPLGAADAANLVMEACEGLAEAHAMSLVHRDIKPANLFLARRADSKLVLKILDFGISKRLNRAAVGKSLTDPGRSLGSPWYMAPEQMRNAARVDQRADIWSLGVLLFELLTKQPPFDGEAVPEVCAKVLTEPTPSLRALAPEVDPDLEAIVMRCLEKDADLRYQTVAELMRDLAPHTSRLTPSSIRDGLGSLAPIVDDSRLGRRSRSRLPAILLAAAVGGALGLLGLPGAVDWPKLERRVREFELRLPWDPVLGVSPLEAATLDRKFEAPAMIVKVTLDAPDPRSTVPTDPAADGSQLTADQIRRRNENYEQWLKSQGLTRLDAIDADPFGKPVLELP
jgi:serine/threonine protein kinase